MFCMYKTSKKPQENSDWMGKTIQSITVKTMTGKLLRTLSEWYELHDIIIMNYLKKLPTTAWSPISSKARPAHTDISFLCTLDTFCIRWTYPRSVTTVINLWNRFIQPIMSKGNKIKGSIKCKCFTNVLKEESYRRKKELALKKWTNKQKI